MLCTRKQACILREKNRETRRIEANRYSSFYIAIRGSFLYYYLVVAVGGIWLVPRPCIVVARSK